MANIYFDLHRIRRNTECINRNHYSWHISLRQHNPNIFHLLNLFQIYNLCIYLHNNNLYKTKLSMIRKFIPLSLVFQYIQYNHHYTYNYCIPKLSISSNLPLVIFPMNTHNLCILSQFHHNQDSDFLLKHMKEYFKFLIRLSICI
jgi:hypothetical protein